MNSPILRSGAIAGMALVFAGFVTGPLAVLGQTTQSLTPPRSTTPPTPQQSPPPTNPQRYVPDKQPRTINSTIDRLDKKGGNSSVQLKQAAERRKQRLEEARVQADQLVERARKMRADIAGGNTGETYDVLSDHLVHVGTDLQAMVTRMRVCYEEPSFQEEQLRTDSSRMVAMDNLLSAVLKALHEADRMSDPITVLAAR